MWECTSCGWTGDTEDLKPTTVNAGIQGKVKTSACPKCGKTVGDDVVIAEDISQEISETAPGTIIDNEGGGEGQPGGNNEGGGEGGGGEEFPCLVPDCGKSYKTKRGLDNHMQTHETEE